MNSVLFAWFLLINLFGRENKDWQKRGPPLVAEPRRWPVSLNLRKSEGWQKRGRPWWRSHDGGRFL
uniref:Uncharacterized protein n=1 Tax=Helianthus annuus TaxID=4232 RepID=A0A251UQ69_HELAN